MDSPRVAVIIPCYNDGPTLSETLQSVLAQDEPTEIVIVNDGSTDPDTLALFTEIAAQGVKIVHQENRGLSAARMAGVAVTSAHYILPLDADDVLLPKAIRQLADALDGNPEAGVAYGDYEMFGEREGERLVVIPHLDPWLITYLNTVPVASLLRRAALEDTDGWVMRHGYEDWDLWMQFAEAGWRGVYVPEIVYRRRLHGTRMLGEARDRHKELYSLLKERHPQLFAGRALYRREESISIKQRLLYPLFLGERKYAPLWLENGLKWTMMRAGIRV